MTDPRGTVHVVAIATLNESFVDSMAIRFRKICFRGSVAPIAKARLLLNEKKFLFLRMVGRVAVEATNVRSRMRRFREMGLLAALAVALQAACTRLLSRQSFETDNLGWVGFCGVSCAGPVAALASHF